MYTKKLKASQNYAGFTLAEVLIVLGIIGTVAALTIPSLINKTNEKENIASWKKMYSVMSQVWMEIVQDNGGSVGGLFNTTGYELSNDYGDLIFNKLSTLKKCPAASTGDSEGECWHKSYEFYTLNKKPINVAYTNTDRAILKDGMFLLIGAISNSCSTNSENCFYFGVDVNGKKGPNVQGRDIFYGNGKGAGRITPHVLTREPSDSSDDYNCIESSTSTSISQGQGCSKLAILCDGVDYSKGTCKN